MFNVDLTSMVYGCNPSRIVVATRSHSAALFFYRTALRADQVGQNTLESGYGFRFRVDSARQNTTRSVRLDLPARVNRQTVARALGGRTGQMTRARNGYVVTDPFGIRWTITS